MSNTAQDQINRALRLLGVLAEGESPSADSSNDALLALNQMLDSWSTERLSVFSLEEQIFTWPTSTATRTLGPSGDFVGDRPAKLDDATYFKDPNSLVSFPIQIINREEYDSIALKTNTSTYPQVINVNMTNPNVTMTLYPVPTLALEWHFICVQALSQPALLTTVLVFPPGYLRAFAYSLACEIGPEFGVEPSPTVQRIAIASKRDLKRINDPMDVMSIPSVIVGNRNSRFNVYTGYPQ